MASPERVDPEIAAALLAEHLDAYLAHSPHATGPAGWTRHDLDPPDPLRVVLGVPARPGGMAGGRSAGADSRVDRYHVLVDASWYDTWPVRVTFVEPDGSGWRPARLGSRAYPLIAGSPGAPPGPQPPVQFALHDAYGFQDGETRQLVCFSYSFDYYISGHQPSEQQAWRAGRDRLDATLNRLYRIINSSAYLGPSGRRAA